jgi:tRNA modification GTPase
LVNAATGRPSLVVANKQDLSPAWSVDVLRGETLQISAATGHNLDQLADAITSGLLASESLHDTPAITNVRHIELLAKAGAALQRAADAVRDRTAEEFVAADLAEARALLEEITGVRTPDDVLEEIFSKFCIGK